MRGSVLREVDDVEAIADDWDELAVASAAPYCSPGWMLAWWQHLAPRSAELRVVAVWDGNELLGVGPFFFKTDQFGLNHYRVLAAGKSYRVHPVARPGQEARVARVIGKVLLRTTPPPDVVVFEGVPRQAPWAELICDSWPSRRSPWLHRDKTLPSPVVTRAGRSFSEWLSSQSSNFRKSMRYGRRRLEREGAKFRLLEAEQEIDGALDAFASLHNARWEDRSGSAALNPRVERMLRESALRFLRLGDQRFRLWSIEVEHKVISSHLFLAAGGEVTYWLGGFDDDWAARSPAMQSILSAIEHAWSAGDARVDLGGGKAGYKDRFADAEDVLEWVSLVPREGRYLRTRALLIPGHFRQTAVTHLPAGMRWRLKRMAKAWQRLRRDPSTS